MEADDDHVGFHLRTVDVFERFAKVDHCISGRSASQRVGKSAIAWPDSLL
jgi:hypothetical protein